MAQVVEVVVTAAGPVDAIAYWFDLDVPGPGTLCTGPGGSVGSHWKQARHCMSCSRSDSDVRACSQVVVCSYRFIPFRLTVSVGATCKQAATVVSLSDGQRVGRTVTVRERLAVSGAVVDSSVRFTIMD